MIRSDFPAMPLALIGGAMMLFGTASAAALPGFAAASPSATGPVATGLVDKVREGGRDVLTYDRRLHGERHRSRRPGFTFYYGGYYYSNPWWQDPGIDIGTTPPDHVQWCLNRYRSYDVGTDTYVPRIGVRVRCNSPYMTR